MTDLSQKPLLTTAEAAEYLGLTVKGLRRRLDRGTFPRSCCKRLGGSLRFVRARIDLLALSEVDVQRKPRRIA
jgi:predicted DNA-binding transcriptional regulator AlpA